MEHTLYTHCTVQGARDVKADMTGIGCWPIQTLHLEWKALGSLRTEFHIWSGAWFSLSSLMYLGPEGGESPPCSLHAISRPSPLHPPSMFLSDFPPAISLSLSCCHDHPTSITDDFYTWPSLFSSTSSPVFIVWMTLTVLWIISLRQYLELPLCLLQILCLF